MCFQSNRDSLKNSCLSWQMMWYSLNKVSPTFKTESKLQWVCPPPHRNNHQVADNAGREESLQDSHSCQQLGSESSSGDAGRWTAKSEEPKGEFLGECCVCWN